MGQTRVGLMSLSSTDTKYRYPMALRKGDIMADLDALIILPGAVCTDPSRPVVDVQRKNLLDKIFEAVKISPDSKVLLPSDPFLLLELSDILTFKIDDRIRLQYFSSSIQAILEYANINVNYLNERVQKNIFEAKYPFSIS